MLSFSLLFLCSQGFQVSGTNLATNVRRRRSTADLDSNDSWFSSGSRRLEAASSRKTQEYTKSSKKSGKGEPSQSLESSRSKVVEKDGLTPIFASSLIFGKGKKSGKKSSESGKSSKSGSTGSSSCDEGNCKPVLFVLMFSRELHLTPLISLNRFYVLTQSIAGAKKVRNQGRNIRKNRGRVRNQERNQEVRGVQTREKVLLVMKVTANLFC
jgi:hypothetical protein